MCDCKWCHLFTYCLCDCHLDCKCPHLLTEWLRASSKYVLQVFVCLSHFSSAKAAPYMVTYTELVPRQGLSIFLSNTSYKNYCSYSTYVEDFITIPNNKPSEILLHTFKCTLLHFFWLCLTPCLPSTMKFLPQEEPGIPCGVLCNFVCVWLIPCLSMIIGWYAGWLGLRDGKSGMFPSFFSPFPLFSHRAM